MKSTSVTITFRLNNDDIQGSIDAIKALLATLNESLNPPTATALEVVL